MWAKEVVNQSFWDFNQYLRLLNRLKTNLLLQEGSTIVSIQVSKEACTILTLFDIFYYSQSSAYL